MRINEANRLPVDSLKPAKRPNAGSRSDEQSSVVRAEESSQSTAGVGGDVSRAERIEQLKQMFSSGRPIDVNKLADKLIESGIFFNEKA